MDVQVPALLPDIIFKILLLLPVDSLFICKSICRDCMKVYGGFVAPVRDYQVAYGFGYDSYTDDYKVVAVRKSNNKVKVYSLKTGIWKNVSDFPDAYLLEDGVFLNGCIHWLDYLPNNLPNIVSFDLLTETYSQVSHPEYDEGEKSYVQKAVTDIWVMQDDSWTNSLSIMYPEDHDGWGRFWQTYWMSNDGKILIRFGYRVFLYDSNNSSFTLVNETDDCQWVCSFDESLVSPIGPRIRYRLRSWKVKSRMGESSSSAI
ncbi:F-box associated interaction domain-containing protein [Artemisia annua]|uniref:F-box associated interaction domain-containing protein n=1 Tax=Artemisia annua TaxID=35608 RepID=A0A2U1L266_ARTAN|nr:F-box associated interaction domain-containing protein [Artemisia annua]